MSAPAILLLEDDPAIAATVSFALQREGMAVTQVLLVREAERLLRQGWDDARAADPRPALAILDVGLPDGSGLDLCRSLRQSTDPVLKALPVLMLTARSEEIDRVLGLELGADDYMAKPFSPRELVARVRALLRRAALSGPAVGSAAGGLGSPAASGFLARFELDEPGQRVRYAGTWLTLTRLEFGLLRVLLAAPTRIHSRDSLLDAVWGQSSDAADRTVDTHIKTLRAKLRAVTPGQDPIATHRGLGYGLDLDGR